jgi:hypothetical protein
MKLSIGRQLNENLKYRYEVSLLQKIDVCGGWLAPTNYRPPMLIFMALVL